MPNPGNIRRALAACAILAATANASADVCFTGFNGAVHYQFAGSTSDFTTPGTRNVSGVTFGSLAQ